MTSRYRVFIELDVKIVDENQLRAVAHEQVQIMLEEGGGVVPNDFVDNDLQAADAVAQDMRMAVTAAMMRLAIGGSAFVPGIEVENSHFRNEPLD